MQGLISNLIRPFRFRYSIFDLGPKFGQKYERQDSNVLNDRGFKIQYSYYKNKQPSDVCLVYAHCNSGCRVQGIQFIQPVIEKGWNLCLFDFAGSGISQGQYISLGYYQSSDLQTIISVMLQKGNNKINLWGRSMGAATIILYLSQTKQIDNIISCVLDSPYCSLWKVIKQFGKSKTKIPQFIVQHLMEYIRKYIIKDHQFDIKNLQLYKKIQSIDIPIMFIASTQDSFVNCSHAAQLYKLTISKHKILEYIQKQHNSPRQTYTLTTGLDFMNKSLNQKQKIKKQMRILSKKKQLCRKMTGNNMAELIIKPTKKPIKNQSISAGNLARFRSFCTQNKQQQQQQQNIDTYRKQQQYRKQNTSINKNPHTIQHSIIKLAMPPKQIIQKIKNKQSYNSQTTQYSNIGEQQLQFNATLNPYTYNYNTNTNNNTNMNTNQQNFMNTQIQTNINKYNMTYNNQQFRQDLFLGNSISNNNNNNQIVYDKQNNLNISNNMHDVQENIFHTHSEVKDFNTLLTKKNNFEVPIIPNNLRINIQRQDKVSKDKKQIKDQRQKIQKINKLYIRQRKSVDQAIILGKQTDSHKNQKPNKANRQNGIQLINKINKTSKINMINLVSSHTNSPIHNKNNAKQRVKTQIIQTNYNNQQQSSSEQYNIIQQDNREYHNSKIINRDCKSSRKHRNSAYSDISIEQQERVAEPVRWNCQPKNFCQLNFIQDQSKQATNSKYRKNNKIRQTNFIEEDVSPIMPPRRSQLSYNQVWNNQQNQLQLKHFQSIGDLPTSIDYSQYQNNKNDLIKDKNMNKTQKIIKIQLDRNILKANQSIKTQKQPAIMAYKSKLLQTNNMNPGIQINPASSKLKMKNKKMLKINTIQTNNSFLI